MMAFLGGHRAAISFTAIHAGLDMINPVHAHLTQVGALTFDVFGTVVDWRSGIIREGEALGEQKSINADWASFADDWRELYQPQIEKVRSGELPWTKLDDLHRMSLDILLAKYGIDKLSKAETDHFNRAWHRLDPWPDAVEGLTRLRTRYALATLSNGNVSLLMNMAKRAGLPWDAILGAEPVRCYKPLPDAYRGTAELLSLPPERCLMVAAHPGDLVAASQAGFRTAYVHRPLESGPEKVNQEWPKENFDVLAEDFLDLAAQLGC